MCVHPLRRRLGQDLGFGRVRALQGARDKRQSRTLEYELRTGEFLQWRLRLPHELDEAVVGGSSEVDGFAIVTERGSAAIAYVGLCRCMARNG